LCLLLSSHRQVSLERVGDAGQGLAPNLSLLLCRFRVVIFRLVVFADAAVVVASADVIVADAVVAVLCFSPTRASNMEGRGGRQDEKRKWRDPENGRVPDPENGRVPAGMSAAVVCPEQHTAVWASCRLSRFVSLCSNKAECFKGAVEQVSCDQIDTANDGTKHGYPLTVLLRSGNLIGHRRLEVGQGHATKSQALSASWLLAACVCACMCVRVVHPSVPSFDRAHPYLLLV